MSEIDIHDIQRLEEIEAQIKVHTEQLNAELGFQRDANIESLKVETKIKIITNSLRQLQGERDSLKKKISVLPR